VPYRRLFHKRVLELGLQQPHGRLQLVHKARMLVCARRQ
jgi:hypothetical protein